MLKTPTDTDTHTSFRFQFPLFSLIAEIKVFKSRGRLETRVVDDTQYIMIKLAIYDSSYCCLSKFMIHLPLFVRIYDSSFFFFVKIYDSSINSLTSGKAC